MILNICEIIRRGNPNGASLDPLGPGLGLHLLTTPVPSPTPEARRFVTPARQDVGINVDVRRSPQRFLRESTRRF